MRLSRFHLAVIAIVVAAAVLTGLAVILMLPGHSTEITRTTFDLSRTLPTGTINATNPLGCGMNETDFLSLPASAVVHYYVTVNQSGDRAHLWVTGEGSPANVTITYGNETQSSFTVGGVVATVTFVFQGCGPTANVPLGFWGDYSVSHSS